MSDATDSYRGEVRARLDARREEILVRESEALYRDIFEQLPASIWVEDWSAAKAMIDRLTRRGVKDWRRYFRHRPDQLINAANAIEVVDVSQATLDIYRATSKEDVVITTTGENMTPDELDGFREQLVAFAEGATRFETDARERTLDGGEVFTRIKSIIPRGHRSNWGRVLYTIEDITERKRAEEALKESERTLAAAQRIAGLGHWLWDEVENRIITLSEQLARIFGVEPEEFPRTGEGWFAFIHPDDRERAVAEIERCIANQSGFDLEYRIIRKDGQIRFVRDLSEPLFDDGGRFVRTLGTLLDITDLKRTEQALRESEARLAEAQRIAKLGHWIWDEKVDRQVYASEAGKEIFGTPPGWVAGNFDEWLAMVHPDDRGGVATVMEQAYEDRTGYDVEYKIVRADGEIRSVHERAEVELDDAGRVVRTMGTVQDITERKQAEEALRESEQRFRRIFQEGPLGMAIVAPDFGFTAVNDRLCQLLGYTGDELTSLSFPDITHPEDIDKDVELAGKVFRGEIPYYTIEKRYIKKNKEILSINLTASVVRDRHENPLYGLAMIEDITERKRAEQEAYQLSKLAALGTIVAGMAHELAQPVNVISMASETALIAHEMDRVIDKSERYETFKSIHAQATRMGDIIKHLRDFGRTTPGEMEDLDIAVVVRDAVRLGGNQLELDGVKLIVDTPPTCRVIKGRRVELEQVLLNLFTNGRDAIVEQRNVLSPGVDDVGGEIRAEVEDDPRSPNILVRVSDNAGGIPEELLDRIFDPFFTTKDSTKAMGLGLAICYRSIVNMGGRIRARNLERGAQFELDLPVKANA